MKKVTHSRSSAMGMRYTTLFKTYKGPMIFVFVGILLSVAGSAGNILMTNNVVSQVEEIINTVESGGKADFSELFGFITITSTPTRRATS